MQEVEDRRKKLKLLKEQASGSEAPESGGSTFSNPFASSELAAAQPEGQARTSFSFYSDPVAAFSRTRPAAQPSPRSMPSTLTYATRTHPYAQPPAHAPVQAAQPQQPAQLQYIAAPIAAPQPQYVAIPPPRPPPGLPPGLPPPQQQVSMAGVPPHSFSGRPPPMRQPGVPWGRGPAPPHASGGRHSGQGRGSGGRGQGRGGRHPHAASSDRPVSMESFLSSTMWEDPWRELEAEFNKRHKQ